MPRSRCTLARADALRPLQALRALITAGRLDSSSLLQPVLADAPTVRQVFDWQDVEWAKLSWPEKLQARARGSRRARPAARSPFRDV
jgi:hypothetical protein